MTAEATEAPPLTYNVHLYREMRLYFPGILATSPQAAATIAAEKPPHEADAIDGCDGETFAALVDVAGDDDHRLSRTLDFEAGRLLNNGRELLAALQIIAAEEEACTCHIRSWYGENHDTQCPLRIVRDAAARMTEGAHV